MKQIEDLKDVFENTYHFTVRQKQLETGRDGKADPSAQLNHHLAQFIYEEDKDDSLLIVYYAGHGVRNVKQNDLELLG